MEEEERIEVVVVDRSLFLSFPSLPNSFSFPKERGGAQKEADAVGVRRKLTKGEGKARVLPTMLEVVRCYEYLRTGLLKNLMRIQK